MLSELHQRLGRAIQARDLHEITIVVALLEDKAPDWIHTHRAKAWEAQLSDNWDRAVDSWIRAHEVAPDHPAPVLSLLVAASKSRKLDQFLNVFCNLDIELRFIILKEMRTNQIVFIENEVVHDFFNYVEKASHNCPLLILWTADHHGAPSGNNDDAGAFNNVIEPKIDAFSADMLVSIAGILLRFREWKAAERVMLRWLEKGAVKAGPRNMRAEQALGMTGLIDDYFRALDYPFESLHRAESKSVWIIDTAPIHYPYSHHLSSLMHITDYLTATTRFSADDIAILTSGYSKRVEELDVYQSNELSFRTYAGVPHGKKLGAYPNRMISWLRQDLDRLNCDAVDLMVFKTVTPNMFKAVCDWLAWRDGKDSFNVIIDFLPVAYLPRELNTAANLRMSELVLRPFNKLLNLKSIRPLLHSELGEASKQLKAVDAEGQVFKRAIYSVASVAEKYKRREIPVERPRKIRVGMMGATREDKGYGMLPELISLADDSNFPVEWRLQFDKAEARNFRERPFMQADLDRLEQNPNVSIFSSFPTQDEYYRAFSDLDVVLLPYGERYQSSSSGIIIEAIELNVVPIVPSGSTMEEIAFDAGAPHLSVAEVTPEAIFAALKQYFIDAEDLLAMWETSDLSAFYIEKPMTEFLRREGLIPTD